MIRSDTFLGKETQRREMRKGCDLPRCDPFILSLNLIGEAQQAPHVAHQIGSNDNSGFPCCFITSSNVFLQTNTSSFGRIPEKVRDNSSFSVRLTAIQSMWHRSRFVNTELPIFLDVILSHFDVGIWSSSGRAYLCVSALRAQLAPQSAVKYSAIES